MKKLFFITALISGLFINAQTYIGSTVLSSASEVPITLDVSINSTTGIVEFTFVGSESMYYSVGFDAQFMSDAPYIFLTQESTVQERKLTGGRSAGNLLSPEITISSDVVNNGARTIVFTRALSGLGSDYYDFSSITDGTVLNLIWAEGSSLNIQRHSRRGTTNITFTEDLTLSINDIRTQSDSSYVQLYPNPVETKLTIDNYEKLKTLEVYDMKHSKVATYEGLVTEGQIDMSELASGTYIIKCVGSDNTTVSEMIIKK